MTSINSLCANDHNRDVKSDSEPEASEDPGNGVYRPHVPARSGGKKEEGSLEHHRETLDESVQWPFLKPIAFALTVSATVDRFVFPGTIRGAFTAGEIVASPAGSLCGGT